MQTGRKKSRAERKVLKKHLIEESDDDDSVISNFEGNNSTDYLSELDDEMETGSINDNFRNVFHSASSLSYYSESHPVSIKNLSYKPQIIVAKNSLLDVFES